MKQLTNSDVSFLGPTSARVWLNEVKQLKMQWIDGDATIHDMKPKVGGCLADAKNECFNADRYGINRPTPTTTPTGKGGGIYWSSMITIDMDIWNQVCCAEGEASSKNEQSVCI